MKQIFPQWQTSLLETRAKCQVQPSTDKYNDSMCFVEVPLFLFLSQSLKLFELKQIITIILDKFDKKEEESFLDALNGEWNTTTTTTCFQWFTKSSSCPYISFNASHLPTSFGKYRGASLPSIIHGLPILCSLQELEEERFFCSSIPMGENTTQQSTSLRPTVGRQCCTHEKKACWV